MHSATTDADHSPSLEERLQAALHGVAFGPPLRRGLLRITGKQRLDLLHRLSTQAVARLAPGEAVYAAFLDGKARVLAEGMVVARADDVLLDVDPAAAGPLVAHLRKYVLRDDVQVSGVDDELRVAPILGPHAEDTAKAHAGVVPAWPNPRRGAPAWDLVLPEGGWDYLRHTLRELGATEVSTGDLEVLRILAGIPRWGAEVDDGRLVMEAGLLAGAVSFDKGCYLGQEIVLRGTFRGQVQRGLVQVVLPRGAEPGAKLRAGEQEVGVVTSAADAPEGRVGLAYLRRAHWATGTRLATDGGEAVVRRVLVTEKE
jgi:folate-binding protein YgfZ